MKPLRTGFMACSCAKGPATSHHSSACAPNLPTSSAFTDCRPPPAGCRSVGPVDWVAGLGCRSLALPLLPLLPLLLPLSPLSMLLLLLLLLLLIGGTLAEAAAAPERVSPEWPRGEPEAQRAEAAPNLWGSCGEADIALSGALAPPPAVTGRARAIPQGAAAAAAECAAPERACQQCMALQRRRNSGVRVY